MFGCVSAESEDAPRRSSKLEFRTTENPPVDETASDRVRFRDRTADVVKGFFGLHKKEHWENDDFFPSCYNKNCGRPFTFTRRRHHCRRCGFVYCHDCSSREIPGNQLPGKGLYDDNVPQRVCDSCYDYVTSDAQRHRSDEPGSERIDSFLIPNSSASLPHLEQSMSLSPAVTPHQSQAGAEMALRQEDLDWCPWTHSCDTRVAAFAAETASKAGLDPSWIPELARLASDAFASVGNHVAWHAGGGHACMHGGSAMNVLNFVRTKVIAHAGEHMIHSGIVLRHNVPHRSMRKSLENPKILVCMEMLQFRQADVLEMDLQKQLEAEQNYARNAAKKIAAMRPDVVVTKEATRLLLDEMIKMGIVVINGLTESEILRIAHATAATPVTMTHMGERPDAMGTCQKFEVKTYREGMSLSTSSASHTYCFFVGCSPARIATVILRGKPLPELLAAKTAMQSMLRMVHDLSLESSLAANICWPVQVEQLAVPAVAHPEVLWPELRFGFATYCSEECQLQQRKPIAWRQMHVHFYDDEEALPRITGQQAPEEGSELKVRDMTLAAFLIDCYNSAKSSRRVELCAGQENCLQKVAGKESIATGTHSFRLIRIMNHVLKVSVIKHQVPVDCPNDDIKIVSGSSKTQEEHLRLMEASRSISLGKFLWLTFFDATMQLDGHHVFRGLKTTFVYQDAKIVFEYFDLPSHTLSLLEPSYFPNSPNWLEERESASSQPPEEDPVEGVMSRESLQYPMSPTCAGEPAIVLPAVPDRHSTPTLEPQLLSSPLPDTRSVSSPVLTSLPPIPASVLPATIEEHPPSPAPQRTPEASCASLEAEEGASGEVTLQHVKSNAVPLCRVITDALTSEQHLEVIRIAGKLSLSVISPIQLTEIQDEAPGMESLESTIEGSMDEILIDSSKSVEIRVGEDQVSVFLPCHYHALRCKEIGPEQAVHEALRDAMPTQTSGGKKGSFHMSSDKKLFMKEITKQEFATFAAKAKQFMQHFESGDPSVLSKIFGLFRIKHLARKNSFGSGVTYAILMQNAIPANSKYSVFDLKGCTYGRSSEAGTGYEDNLFELTKGYPLFLPHEGHRHLCAAISRDSEMLRQIQVMDYSLLLGINSQTKEIIVRIIDYGREYGLGEAIERVVKGGRTVEKPEEYMKRLGVFCNNVLERFDEHPRVARDNSMLNWGVSNNTCAGDSVVCDQRSSMLGPSKSKSDAEGNV